MNTVVKAERSMEGIDFLGTEGQGNNVKASLRVTIAVGRITEARHLILQDGIGSGRNISRTNVVTILVENGGGMKDRNVKET